MQVRKLKCSSCGANKVVANATSYMYCDYCGEFIGYDFERMSQEVMSKLSSESRDTDTYNSYMETVTRLGEATSQKDVNAFEKAVIDLHHIEIDLFPERYSPKMKQQAYRNQYNEFYKRFWAERLQNHFFEEQDALQKEMASCMPDFVYTLHEGKITYAFNDAMKKYFDIAKRYAKDSAQKTMASDSIMYYPERMKEGVEDMMFKQTIAGFARMLDADSFKEALSYLGLVNEYIEIPDVILKEEPCLGCGHPFLYPENAQKIVCEQCGVENKPAQHALSCMNCGCDFVPDMQKMETACPQCGSLFIPVKNA
ncbi:MAG: hypothetical protein IAE67_09950 [Candidatus Competibacteraceae bacterium]|nr:hypothetical protein [Candidatus Competibacteraceae bacterium]